MLHKAHCNHVGHYTQLNYSARRMCTVGDEHSSTYDASPRKVFVEKSSAPTVVASIGAVEQRRLRTNDDDESVQEGESAIVTSESDTETEQLDESYQNVRTCGIHCQSIPIELDKVAVARSSLPASRTQEW